MERLVKRTPTISCETGEDVKPKPESVFDRDTVWTHLPAAVITIQCLASRRTGSWWTLCSTFTSFYRSMTVWMTWRMSLSAIGQRIGPARPWIWTGATPGCLPMASRRLQPCWKGMTSSAAQVGRSVCWWWCWQSVLLYGMLLDSGRVRKRRRICLFFEIGVLQGSILVPTHFFFVRLRDLIDV